MLPAAGPGTEIAPAVGVIPYQRGLPDPKKRVTQLFPEGVHLRRRVHPSRRRRVVENLIESAHSAQSARMAPLTSGRSGLSVDSIAASLMPAAAEERGSLLLVIATVKSSVKKTACREHHLLSRGVS